MSQLTEKEIEAKCQDISKLVKLYSTIVEYEKNELDLKDALIKIGDFAGDSQNSISFNYSDEQRNYIRNKYGYIQRKNDDTAEPNENGIYFEKLYHLKVILEEKPEFQFTDDESDRLKSGLIGLKEKIKYILHSEDDFIQTKDDLVCLINSLNLSNNPKMSDIIAISKKYYNQHSLTKIKNELINFEAKNFDFKIQEDRYYFARKCVIIGELLKEFMVDEDKNDTSDAFEQFTKIRGELMHSHKIISMGLIEEENNDELNENIKKIGKSMYKMIQADDENNLSVNYADKKSASCLKVNSQNVLKFFQKGITSDASPVPEANEPKLKQKDADKDSPKSFLVMFDTKVKLAESINLSTKNSTQFTDLNAKYQESFKKLSKSERNDYVNYPEHLTLDNKEKIAEIAEEIKEAAKIKQEAGSKSTNPSDELELSLIVVNTLKNIDQELEYLTIVEQLENIPTKKDYVIQHIIATIGQYQRELGDASVAELISQISSEIVVEASESARSARNLGLAHNIFAFSPNELKELIKRDIIPARDHFKVMLTTSDQAHKKIPESIKKLTELAESFFTLGLYNKAIGYWKQIMKRSEERSQEVNFKLCSGDDIFDIHQMLFGMEDFCFNAHTKCASTYLLNGNYEEAFEVLLPLTDKIFKANNFSSIKHLSACHKNDLTSEIADISLLAGLCFSYHGLFKAAVILLEKAKELSKDTESSSSLFCQIKMHLATCYFALNQYFEAKILLEEILNQSELHPIVEVKSLRIYTTLLTQMDEMNSIGTKRIYTERAKAISKKIANENEFVGNEYFNIQMETIVIELETLIADSKMVHIGQDHRTLSDLQIELESVEKRSIYIISKIKNDLKLAGLIPLLYSYIALGYSCIITDGYSTLAKEKPKYAKTKYYFDKVEKMYNHPNSASGACEYAFTTALQALSNACNNFAYFIEDIKERIEYLEEALHWLRLIFSSDLKLNAQQHKVFSDELCLTLGNTGIEYHNLGKHYWLGLLNYEKSFDDAFQCFKDALSHFTEMLKINGNKIYITKEKDIEVLKSFALSYESAGFLRYNLSFMRNAMMFFDEALKEWDTKTIKEIQEHCRQIISCMKSAFEEIQNHLYTKQARDLDQFSVFEIDLLYPEVDLHALTFYSKNLKKKQLIHDFEITKNCITLLLTKRNIEALKIHIRNELQFIDDIETRKSDEPRTFIFTYKKNSNDGVSKNDRIEQTLKVTNKKGIEYYKVNDFDKAIKAYNECLQLLDKLSDCKKKVDYKVTYLFNRARAHHMKGDLLAAICDYHATLKINNAHEKASNYLKSCFETDSQLTTKENTQEQKLIRLLTNGINIVNKFSANKV